MAVMMAEDNVKVEVAYHHDNIANIAYPYQ